MPKPPKRVKVGCVPIKSYLSGRGLGSTLKQNNHKMCQLEVQSGRRGVQSVRRESNVDVLVQVEHSLRKGLGWFWMHSHIADANR